MSKDKKSLIDTARSKVDTHKRANRNLSSHMDSTLINICIGLVGLTIYRIAKDINEMSSTDIDVYSEGMNCLIYFCIIGHLKFNKSFVCLLACFGMAGVQVVGWLYSIASNKAQVDAAKIDSRFPISSLMVVFLLLTKTMQASGKNLAESNEKQLDGVESKLNDKQKKML